MTRLLADFQGLRLNESNWTDAQRLMARWRKWGYYQGACDSTDCTYTILVSDPYSALLDRLSETSREQISNSKIPTFAENLGWRWSVFLVQFAVQDQKIVRTRTDLLLNVADGGPPEHYSYTLGIRTQVRPNLGWYVPGAGPSIRGRDEQLDNHPDWKVGRPDGCEGCQNTDITYTPNLRPTDVLQLTNFNFACLTRFHPCTTEGDLLPIAQNWHLYDGGRSSLYGSDELGPVPCRTPLRALGRDSVLIVEVQTLSVTSQKDPQDPSSPLSIETAKVRLLHVIKGYSPAKPGAVFQISAYPGSPAAYGGYPAFLPEHVLPNSQYFLSIDYFYPATKDSMDSMMSHPLELRRCGIIQATTGNLAALKTGIAEDVPYRRPPASEWP